MAVALAFAPIGLLLALMIGLRWSAGSAGTAAVLWIIFPALCIHELQRATGGTAVFGRALAAVSTDRRIVTLLIASFFAMFLEGATGFGTPVALAAPLLVALGFAPAQALLLALIGNAAAVPFGAIGTPIMPLLADTGWPRTCCHRPSLC